MMNKSKFFLGILTGFYFTFPVFASDFQSPRTAALGGAGHASPLLGDALYLNPSFASFNKIHSLSFNYLTYSGLGDSSSHDFHGNNMNFSVLDSDPDSLFQAGAGFTRRNDANFFHLGASKNFLTRYGVGLGGKFIFPNGPSSFQNRISDASLSISGILSEWFQSALMIDNLFQNGTSLNLYREFILGTKFNIRSIVLVYLDPHWAPSLSSSGTQFGYESGAEFPFFKDFFLRVGKFINSNVPFAGIRGDGYSIGAGWIGPKLSIDYAASRLSNPTSAISHNFGMTVYF